MIRLTARCRPRPEGTENPELPTGQIEIFAAEIAVLSEAAELPLPVFGDQEYPEDIRLRYRFLDLRRERLHRNIICAGGRSSHPAAAHDGRKGSSNSRRRS